ncbi:glycosyltransferase family protein [Pseudoalteromonas fuliginea]|uniref:Glycosyltransferase n=1 Tax=Pseudoalteromonas fuliginea TaxID=1872678 RepID=A0ABQ6RNN1_9GAMM|nr:glycosyltransferase family 4 protein [Pseudoalteromonas fuliginea]KAA1166422.1 hypothetical protein EU509_00360 [Pseudoalteromonas fuliginea]KAA1169980.1 hypothetical protein EUZ79_00340 [Pseudoalteromonas fuliginea]
MKVILSPHPDNTAGYKFDKNFSITDEHELISLKSKNKLVCILEFMLSLPIIPFFGVFGALTFIRILCKFSTINQASSVCISRSLFPVCLLPKKVSVLYHNIEFLYYLEEAKAERSRLKKVIYYHQYFVLRFLEWRGLGNHTVHCLSLTEARLLRRKGINSIFRKDVLFFYKVLVSQFKDEYDTKSICFFGAFSNVRNRRMAEKLFQKHPNISLFGRYGNLLSKEIKANYYGEIDDFSSFVNKYTFVMIETPKAGVQTKVVDWLEAGGEVCVPVKLRRKMWGKLASE